MKEREKGGRENINFCPTYLYLHWLILAHTLTRYQTHNHLSYSARANHSALCFTYREWSLLTLYAASCLRISMEKPQSRVQA